MASHKHMLCSWTGWIQTLDLHRLEAQYLNWPQQIRSVLGGPWERQFPSLSLFLYQLNGVEQAPRVRLSNTVIKESSRLLLGLKITTITNESW